MRRIMSIFVLFSVKILSHLFYRSEVHWLGDSKKHWKDIRLFVFLNHTSLFEPIFAVGVPFHVLWQASARGVAAGADKTLNRPIAGAFFKLFFPKMVSITRRRDQTWGEFLGEISDDSIILIAPEGRMKRTTGLDGAGRPMSVRGGIADILKPMSGGTMVIAYSGGLHHVQYPGKKFPNLFKTIKVTFEQLSIDDYKQSFSKDQDFTQTVVQDLESRMKKHCPG